MPCDLAVLLQCLQDIASHLHDDQAEELQIQARRVKSLRDNLSLGFKVTGGSCQEVAEFLRGAVGVANTFAAFSPALPADPAHPPADAALVARLPAVVWQASCASYAVDGLLGCLRVTLPYQLDLPPDVIFRLVAACGVALGPGIAAAHRAYQYAAAYLQPAAQAQAARFLAAVCRVLLDAARQAELVLQQLGDAKPAAALRATACRPAHVVELCFKAAPILHWCFSLLGPNRCLVRALACFMPKHCVAIEAALGSGGSQLNRSFASLAAAYTIILALRLLRLPLSMQEGAAPLQQWGDEWLLACSMLGAAELEALEEVPQLATSVAGALLRLLQLRLDLPGTESTTSTLNMLSMEWLVQSAAPATGRPSSRAATQQQQQQGQWLPVCLEWAAVGAAALSALAESSVERVAQGHPAATRTLYADITCFSPVLKRLALAVASWQENPEQMPADAIAPAIAACEVMLRMCGTLLRLLHSAQGSNLASTTAVLYSHCTRFVALVCTCVLPSRRGQLVGVLERDRMAASISHLAASAAKLARLVAQLWQQGAAPLPEKPVDHVDEDLLLTYIMYLVVEGCCEWSEAGSRGQPRALLGNRQLVGTLAALASSVPVVRSAMPRVWNREPSDEGEARTAGQTLVVLAAALEMLKRLADQGGAQQEVAGEEVLLMSLLQATFSSALQLHTRVALSPTGMTAAVSIIVQHTTAWNRSAELAVSGGLLDTAVAWALEAAGTSSQARRNLKGLEHMLGIVVAVGNALLQHVEQQQQQPCDTAAAAMEQWRGHVSALQQLPAARQRQQLCSRAFWQREVKEGMLPAVKSLAGLTGGEEEQPQGQQLALALATQACANPECTNLRGASEGRLRGRRCSGCGVARFCSTECHVAAWGTHSTVCQALRAEGL